MNNRLDYEHLERDVEGLDYWVTNRDVKYWGFEEIRKNKDFKSLINFHDKQQLYLSNVSLFRKGTALYFTYNNKKYYISWTFYSDDYIIGMQKRLKAIKGVSNIQINFGELD